MVKPKGGTAFQLKEPWVMNHQEVAGIHLKKWVIPSGYYLMLGDNRAISDDSRGWGLEPRDGMIGVARVRYWPLDRIGLL
jgi:signal peptidase I